ncbi:ABC transporter ATP-binding protein [Caminibacter pacificus]|uniref:ABC transporter ATP-binding protein n=1 Tax=Caminibacter pacificus TaxID=1424653 RepID=A0AAJ4RDF4_9BACT|nr:ABC transporter ATP-binding protein [Caminibacter pacificus]QCI28636.1 ABC transporter ATP-binding protein [Caminibacter pacificus]ROR40635.1 iron complex transport system ATP-binding protein [Caminibacter pacificus]
MSLIVKNLNFKYKEKEILKDINLEFQKGKMYAILGRNGAGKSTFLKSIAKILKPKGEIIFYENIDNLSVKEFAKKIAFLSQIQNNSSLSVYEFVMLGRKPHFRFLPKLTDKKTVERVLEKLNLKEKKKIPLNSLSGGERQRAAIARILAQNTEVILLDEPTNNLDIKYQIEIIKFLREIKEDKIIISVIHDINLALKYFDEYIFLKNGKIINKGNQEMVNE